MTINQCRQCGRTIGFQGLCLRCRIENERNAILALNDEELAAKTAEVTANGFDEDLCLRLIALRGINTEKIAEYCWEKREFGLPEVFKDASDKLTDEMIAELFNDDSDSVTANRLLTCLAHKGGEAVLKAFAELEKNPREWRKQLYVDPSYYANSGGWTFCKDDGKLIKTAYDKCYPIVKGTSGQRAESPVKLITAAEGKCPDCGCRYINIIELDGKDKRLDFLGIDGTLKVKCCPNCTPFDEAQFCRYELDGRDSEVIPSKGYGMPLDDDSWLDEAESNTFILGEQAQSIYFPCDHDFSCSAVGGFADWVQDCVIMNCPDCGRPMTYLAQIGEEPLGYEGNFYVEICRDCKVAAVLYQQT